MPPPGVSLFRRFRCYLDRPHAPQSSPRPSPPPGVSLFQRFRCDLDRPPAPHGILRHPSLPGVSLFRRFRCDLDRPPALHGPLRHPSLPGVSLFRRFRCYLDRPPALHGPLRHPPLPGVSRFRRFRCYLDCPRAGAGQGTMAAGARKQAASCDAFVLSRRLPAPDAPPIRTSLAGLIAKAPSNSPRTMGRSLGQNCRWPALSPLAPACAPSVEYPPVRGTSRCAPGAFSLTAMIFRSPRA